MILQKYPSELSFKIILQNYPSLLQAKWSLPQYKSPSRIKPILLFRYGILRHLKESFVIDPVFMHADDPVIFAVKASELLKLFIS
jgi:hypothetical protein